MKEVSMINLTQNFPVTIKYKLSEIFVSDFANL